MSALYFSYDKGMYLLTGTKRWLDLGFIKFQPSEIAKIAFILMLAKLLSNMSNKTGPINGVQTSNF